MIIQIDSIILYVVRLLLLKCLLQSSARKAKDFIYFLLKCESLFLFSRDIIVPYLLGLKLKDSFSLSKIQ